MINKNTEKIIELLKDSLLALSILSFVGVIYFIMNNFTNPKMINVVMVIPFAFFLTPYLFLSLYKLKTVDKKMQVIPRFLRDVVDNMSSGMDLIGSIKTTVGNQYSILNEDIQKLVNQLSWNIDFNDAFLKFAENIGSENLKRDFLLVIKARAIGGHVEQILRELSDKITIDNLRAKERKAGLSSNTFTGYISFFIFLLIIVVIYNSLFTGIASMGATDGSMVSSENTSANINLTLLILLSYELAVLSGFLFGMMQNNDLIYGGPHVVLMVVSTFLAFFLFI